MRILMLALVLLAACADEEQEQLATDPLEFVDPFIGTGGHGHTFPGATLPFGMVQLSPDTRLEGWDGCSGYHYSDEYIYGFSHTHLQGTGVSDYGDVLFMPGVGEEVSYNNGADGKPGYRSRFDKRTEKASAGYYAVHLADSGIDVELTTTRRVGVHRYRFPKGVTPHIVIDLTHRDITTATSLEQIDDRTISGHRVSDAWARDQRVFFRARFSDAFQSYSTSDGRAHVVFPADLREITVHVAISGVDADGAARSLEAEAPDDFDAAHEAAQAAWREQLGKIAIEGGTRAQQRTFYTALYHACVAPNLFMDVDGRYRGTDGKTHTASFDYYTVFSLWDTFRAAHPLFTILEPERTNDFVRTMLAQYENGGALPVWELAGTYTGCMIGYHSVPVIADAYRKGIRGYDARLALEAMIHSAKPDGLCGNEDCGQMSAWYVFSALGFYPVTPGTTDYIIGTPIFPRAAIRLENGKTFTVEAPGVSSRNKYIQSATLNGSPHKTTTLAHDAIVRGGTLRFEMGAERSQWGAFTKYVPTTRVFGERIVPVPFVAKGERAFRSAHKIALGTVDAASALFWSLDGGKTFALYAGPATIDATTDVVAYAQRGKSRSQRIAARFLLVPHDWKIKLATKYANQYAATGDAALIDGLRGGADWRTGDWQGYQAVDLDVTIDLGKERTVSRVRASFLQDQRSWIWMPREVAISVSTDGKTFAPFGRATHAVDEKEESTVRAWLGATGSSRARFVRLVAKNYGKCPDWHLGAGGNAWVFADEIEID